MSMNPRDRAKWAWDKVAELKKKENEGLEPRYGTLARKLPAMLHHSGLGQTLAVLHSKQGDRKKGPTGDGLLLAHLIERITLTLGLGGTVSINVVFGLSASKYRLVSRDVMETALWLKRFAEGRLSEEEP